MKGEPHYHKTPKMGNALHNILMGELLGLRNQLMEIDDRGSGYSYNVGRAKKNPIAESLGENYDTM